MANRRCPSVVPFADKIELAVKLVVRPLIAAVVVIIAAMTTGAFFNNALVKDGWRVFVIWECELSDAKKLARRIVRFLENQK